MCLIPLSGKERETGLGSYLWCSCGAWNRTVRVRGTHNQCSAHINTSLAEWRREHANKPSAILVVGDPLWNVDRRKGKEGRQPYFIYHLLFKPAHIQDEEKGFECLLYARLSTMHFDICRLICCQQPWAEVLFHHFFLSANTHIQHFLLLFSTYSQGKGTAPDHKKFTGRKKDSCKQMMKILNNK